MHSLTILALVASASANVYINSVCPVVKPVENFDLEAFGNGVWYELAKYPNDAEKGGQCGTAEYTLVGDTVQVKNYHVTDGRLSTIEGTARLAPYSAHNGKLMYSLPYGDNGTKKEYALWILDTDYENYAIAYYCKYNPQTRSRQDFAWILSRSKTLDSNVKAKIDKFIKESKIIDSSKLQWTDFSEKACSVTK